MIRLTVVRALRDISELLKRVTNAFKRSPGFQPHLIAETVALIPVERRFGMPTARVKPGGDGVRQIHGRNRWGMGTSEGGRWAYLHLDIRHPERGGRP